VTLVELILFIVIVSVALIGVLQVLRITGGNSADPLRRKQALLIAEALLEEVELAKFTYCDPTDPNAADPNTHGVADCTIVENWGQAGAEPVGPRPYDNVNDYVGAANTPVFPFLNGAGQLADAEGTAINVDGYTARLTITPATLNNIGTGGLSADTDVLHITVEVGYDGQTLVLDGYRTRYAPTTP
jgi:MSHA pilin protein MshD